MMVRGTYRIGIEVNLDDLAGDLRRRTLRLADHGGVARGHLTALDGLNLCRGNIDHDVAPASPWR